MRTYVRKLQNKPEHIRQQILWGIIGVSMFFVVFLWIYSLSHRFKKTDQNLATKQEAVGPLKLLGGSLSNAYQNITASVGNISNMSNPLNKKEIVPQVVPEIQKEKQIDLIIIDKQK